MNVPKTWELSEQALPKNWRVTGAAFSRSRRSIQAALFVLHGEMTEQAAKTKFGVSKTFGLAHTMLNKSPELSRRAYDGESLYTLTSIRTYDTGSMFGSGPNALLQDFWNMIDPELRHKVWKLQAKVYHPDTEATGDNAKAARFNSLAAKMEKQNLL